MSGAADAKLQLQGRTSACATLFNLSSCPMGQDGAVQFGIGMLDGVRDWMVAHIGEKAAYEALQAAADRTAASLVVKPIGEGA